MWSRWECEEVLLPREEAWMTASRCSWRSFGRGPSSLPGRCSPPCGGGTRPWAALPGWGPQACKGCDAGGWGVCRGSPEERRRRGAGRRPGQAGSRPSACWSPCWPPPPPPCSRSPCRTPRCNASTRSSASPWRASLAGTCSRGTRSCAEASAVLPPRCKVPSPPDQENNFYFLFHRTSITWHSVLHLLPRDFEISALCISGVASIILWRSIWLQTMNAFIGRLMW